MGKYTPLIERLRAEQADHLLLTFAGIEAILAAPLPASARRYPEWWANSTGGASHKWAQEWGLAGWKVSEATLAAGVIHFRRSAAQPATVLDEMQPRGRAFIMDIVRSVNIDVDAWQFKENGERVRHPKANPRYCYDWSFGSDGEGYLLCLWHRELTMEKGRVVLRSNPFSHTSELRRLLVQSGTTEEQRSRLIAQIRRSEAYESAIRQTQLLRRSLRVALNAGDTRTRDELMDKKSTVWRRMLDPLDWFVHEIAPDGETLIVRGERPEHSTAESPADDDTSPGADDQRRLAGIKQRRGQAEFRERLLIAYGKRCAVTRCTVTDILEAAHIVPHSVERNYRANNGVLLRADIHTLFDLQLLSIDERLRIHVSKLLRYSEYQQYSGRELAVVPDKVSDHPAASNLASRHERFLERELTRL